MKGIRFLYMVLFLLFVQPVWTLDIKIVESSQSNPGHNMDQNWVTVASGMGHTPSIHPQSLLDNTAFFATTDVLIVASGVITLPANRITTIQQWVQSGKPVYIQSEYQCTYSSNQAFSQIVNACGGNFTWFSTMPGTLAPMQVNGTFATNAQNVTPLSYFWYSCTGDGNCTSIFPFLTYGGANHGWYFCPPNPNYGRMITTTDQDWVNQNTSTNLMQNIITHLITPSLCGQNSLLTINLGNDTTVCTGGSLQLNATTNGATYQWSTGATSATINVNTSGTYWVNVNANGCSATDTIVVTFAAPNFLNLGPDLTPCAGSQVVINASTPNATGYSWNTGATSSSITVNSPGTYIATVTVGGCSATDTVIVTYQNNPVANLGPDTLLCAGDQMTLTAGPSGPSYLWQNGSTGNTLQVTQAGTYVVIITQGNCQDVDSIAINYLTVPQVDLGPDVSACTGNTVALNAFQANAAGYIWNDGSTNATLPVTGPGVYSVEVNYGNCSSYDTIQVFFINGLNASFLNDTSTCTGNPITLQPPLADSYSWSTGSTSGTLTLSQSATVWVTITVGACSATDTAVVTIDNVPQVNLGHDIKICEDSTLILTPVDYELNATNLWSTGTTGTSATISLPGVYWFAQTNACGVASDTLEVTLQRCRCTVYIPNAFTANSDVLNDEFTVAYDCEFASYELSIFNRWGERIFTSLHPGDAWTGGDSPNGVYVYLLKYSSNVPGFGEEHVQRGRVCLIR